MANGTLGKGTKLYICATPQNSDLTQSQFEALVWVEVCCPQSLPSFGQEANVISEFCMTGEEISAVGAQSGAETELVAFYQSGCTGQDHLRTAFGGVNAYAFKKEYADSPTPATLSNTIIYTRAIVTSNMENTDGVDEFITNTFGFKLRQKPILVKPTAIP